MNLAHPFSSEAELFIDNRAFVGNLYFLENKVTSSSKNAKMGMSVKVTARFCCFLKFLKPETTKNKM